MWLCRNLRMQRGDEPSRFLVGNSAQSGPLLWFKACRSKHGGGNGEAVGGEILEQSKGQGQRGYCARRRGTQGLVHASSLVADGVEGFGDNEASAIRSSARNEVDQLTPPHRRVVTVLGRLVQNGQQTIVEAHLPGCSFGRTLPLL